MNTNDKEFMAQKIRTQYMEKEHDELYELRTVDKKVKRPANIFAYTFGTLGALILGTGMCLAMNVIGDAVIPGIIIGLTGVAMVSGTYRLYARILEKRRAKYANEIFKLSDKIIKKQ